MAKGSNGSKPSLASKVAAGTKSKTDCYGTPERMPTKKDMGIVKK